jgi:CRISPR system Cascade subunit CasC
MTRTFVDIHVLQTVPPSNINRDDTGSPKTAVFGGVRRARVSSQAWKRAARLAFDDLLDTKDLGVRTKRVVDVVAEAIVTQRPDLTEQAPTLAEGIVRSTGLNVTVPKPKKGAETAGPAETDFLVFVSRQQIDLLARTAIELAAEDDPAAALKAFKGKKLLDQAHSVDLALFGRMVANDTDLNVDASAQVAHAISVHAVDNEYDYFTAVDDVKSAQPGEDAGAGMIGTVEFNSSTLYRYATVDVDHLRESLGDDEATRRAVEAFVTAFVQSMPTGKQNTFANRTLPDAVLVAVRDTQPVNLVGAFEDAVVADGGTTRLEVAGRRLAERSAEVSDVLGHTPVAAWQVAVGAARTGLDSVSAHVAETTTLPGLPTAVDRLGASR